MDFEFGTLCLCGTVPRTSNCANFGPILRGFHCPFLLQNLQLKIVPNWPIGNLSISILFHFLPFCGGSVCLSAAFALFAIGQLLPIWALTINWPLCFCPNSLGAFGVLSFSNFGLLKRKIGGRRGEGHPLIGGIGQFWTQIGLFRQN